MDRKKLCDLHIHSDFSDSDTDVEDVFKQAKEKGIACLAITDHDTIDSNVRARDFSAKYNIELIDAIEFSAQHNDLEVHILGFFIDPQNITLRENLVQIKELRRERILLMVEKLIALGLDIEKEAVLDKIKDSVPTRLHLALSLLEKGAVRTLVEAFRKFLAPGKPGYVGRFRHSVEEAISLIQDAGGLAFIAHPHMLPQDHWVEEFISKGIDGIEAVYPGMSHGRSLLYQSIANNKNILKSGGSDAHGTYKKFTSIGEVTIPYSWVVQMKERISRRQNAIITDEQ